MSRRQPLAPRGPPPPPESIPSKGISRITKSTRACDKCRSLRKRCNGATPCASCHASQITCEYSHIDGRRKEDFKAQIKALQERNTYLEHLVQQLRVNRAEGAIQQPNPFINQSPSAAQQQQESLEHCRPESTTSSATLCSRTPVGPPAPQRSISDAELEHMFYAATAINVIPSSSETPYRQVQTSRRDRLPNKGVTRQALDAFFQCAATLFYVTTEEESTQLLNKVYDNNSASLQDICELCALAAIGSHYKASDIPEETRATYFFIASTSLNEAIEVEGIQGLRIFICLCMSMVMEKSSVARFFIISALNLARGKMRTDLQRQRTASTGSEEDKQRRTLQTLLFLEGWLSYTLGYRNCLNTTDNDLVHYTIPLQQVENATALTTRLIQSNMTKLTLLASGIQDEIPAYSATNYWHHANILSTRLDTWHQSLPPDLHLAALAINGDGQSSARKFSIFQERALYLMHMLYMDMRLQLFCQLLKARYMSCANGDERFPSGFFEQVPEHIIETHTAFAVQLARIAALLYEENAIMTRCWLVIRSVFDVGIVLLLTACQRHESATPATTTISMDDILPHVETCLAVLAFCSQNDVAASRLRDMLEPVFREIVSINVPPAGLDSDSASGSRLGPPGLHMNQNQDAIRTDGDKGQEEMRIQYVLERSPPIGSVLVRVARQLFDLMSPGASVWV